MSKNIEYYMHLPYKIELKELSEEEGAGISLEIPELGRMCAYARGKTYEEAKAELNAVKRLLFEAWIRDGVVIPEPISEQSFSGKFVLRVPPILHKIIYEEAKRNDMSQNTFIVSLLEKALAEKNICDDLRVMISEQTSAIKSAVGFAFLRNEEQYLEKLQESYPQWSHQLRDAS